VRNCVVRGNSLTMGAPYGGGGVLLTAGSAVESCTVVFNAAVDKGGGVYCNGGGTVRNSIVYFNTAPSGPDYSSTGGSFSYCCTAPLAAGTGNMTGDPLLRNAASGDCRLRNASPCIDTGSNLPWMTTAFDLAGNGRIYRRTVDIGAHEDSIDRGTLFIVR
jgi:hypothetical protein